MENNETNPEIIIKNQPEVIAKGIDEQIEKSIVLLMKGVE
jgi:tricorn protease